MKCPACQTEQRGTDAEGRRFVSVIDSRTTGDGSIRRRRKCYACGGRFTTLEVIVDGTNGRGACRLRVPHDSYARRRMLGLADRAAEMAEAIRSELNEQTVLSL